MFCPNNILQLSTALYSLCAEGFALLQLSRACVQLTATQEQKVCQNALSIITLFMKHFDTLFIAKIHPRKGKDRFIGHAD